MKHYWTFSLTACICALLSPIAMAGMAMENDPVSGSVVTDALEAVNRPGAKAQSTPTYSVSLSGPNRIAVSGKKVINAIYDATHLEVQTDALTGQVFVFPKTQEPVALFLTTEDKETHALTLLPQEIRSQEIVLNSSQPLSHGKAASTYPQRAFQQSIETAPDIDSKVTRLIRALARNEVPDGFHATNRCGQSCLKSYASETIVGRVIVHKNTSNRFVTIEEKLFYQKDVLGVAIDKAELAPGESARIYIVTKHGTINEGAL